MQSKMNEYGNGNGSRIGNAKSRQMDEVGIGLDRLSLRAEPEIVFVDKTALKVADILRGCEKDSKQATRNSVKEQSLQPLTQKMC